ncbi:hypothetical protein C8J56DRAFT_883301 [Mycena floridula]|nr:hypothetical protein C8J56DRAFT_883301 [Mycena floridula]
MKLSLIALVASIVIPRALAAECTSHFIGDLTSAQLEWFWHARSDMCTCVANGYGQRCDHLYSLSGVGGYYFQFIFAYPKAQLCWDALENIINQCIANGWEWGTYTYAGTEFQIQRFLSGSTLPDAPEKA